MPFLTLRNMRTTPYYILSHVPRASWHYYFLIGRQFIKLPLISNQLSFSFHSIIIIFYKLTNVWSFSLYSIHTCTYFAYKRNESGDIWDIKSISFIITINSFINNYSKLYWSFLINAKPCMLTQLQISWICIKKK